MGYMWGRGWLGTYIGTSVNRQTRTTESITFLQLHWPVVKINCCRKQLIPSYFKRKTIHHINGFPAAQIWNTTNSNDGSQAFIVSFYFSNLSLMRWNPFIGKYNCVIFTFKSFYNDINSLQHKYRRVFRPEPHSFRSGNIVLSFYQNLKF